jgi:toxin ParE1/3/4
MRIVWTDQANSDLREQIRYIAARDRDAAKRQRARVHEAVSNLRDTPRIGRPGSLEGTRELVISGTPYIVVYALMNDVIEIYHCYHARQARQGDEALDQGKG